VIRVYGPNGQDCGTISSDEDGTTIKTESGQSYTIRVTESGGMEMECPSGLIFALSPEQVDFLAGCSATTEDDGSGVQCEAKPGTFGSDCVFDSDCTASGLACCGPIGEEKTCQISIMCEFLCADDWDCFGGDICCSAGGGYNICLPPQACF